MKVLFIYPSNDLSYPLQIGSLSAFIKQYGHKTDLLSLFIENNITKKHLSSINDKLKDFKPDFVILSCYETSFSWIKEITAYVKGLRPEIVTIIGGYFPTLCPQEVIKVSSIDAICRGEGEWALKEFLDNPQRKNIKNFWFKEKGKIVKNGIRPLIENLDILPFPDKTFFDYQEHLDKTEKKGERVVKIMASRGCPFDCTYCCNKYIKELYPNKNKYLRMRSPKNIVEELKELKAEYSFEKVGFHDDNFTLDLNWLKEFGSLYKKEINLPFYCATRVESCSDKVLDILKKAGCELLLIGVESGDEKYRREIMKRFMSNQSIISAFNRARKKGILTWSFSMVGLPFETKQMLLKTVCLNWQCRPDFVMASIFYPFKGTQLGDICYNKGWVNLQKKDQVTSYAWESILDHPNLSDLEIKIAKYLNSLTAIRSSFFWKQLLIRLNDLIKYNRRI